MGALATFDATEPQKRPNSVRSYAPATGELLVKCR